MRLMSRLTESRPEDVDASLATIQPIWVVAACASRSCISGCARCDARPRLASGLPGHQISRRGLGPRLRPRSAAAVVRLVEELCDRALESLQIEVKVEDLVDGDRLGGDHRLRFGNRLFDPFDRATRDPQHDDEGHLALPARDLQVKPLLFVAEDLDVAPFEAASTYRAVVEAGPVADELDDAHREPILRRANCQTRS